MDDLNNLMPELVAASQRIEAFLIRVMRRRSTPALPPSGNVELEALTREVARSNARLKRIEQRRGLP